MRLATRIMGSGSVLPGRMVSTQEVCALAYPGRDPADLIARTGIEQRYWAEPGLSRARAGAQALRRALERAGLSASALERIVFVDSTCGDRRLPNTASAVADALDLQGSCDCVDLNNACVGFLSAMDWAARSTATGHHPIAVVTSELWSQVIHESEPRTYAVFGDAAVATIFGAARDDHEGVVSSWLRNDGRLQGSVSCLHAGADGEPQYVRFRTSNEQIGNEATDAIVRAMKHVLSDARVAQTDVRWVLPHQPNGRMFTKILECMGIDPTRTVPLTAEVGSVGAASVPLSLDRLLAAGRLAEGDLVLLSAVGAGMGYGAILYRVGAS